MGKGEYMSLEWIEGKLITLSMVDENCCGFNIRDQSSQMQVL